VGVRLALKALERAGRGPTAPPPTPAPIAFPSRAYADTDRFELTEAGLALLATLDAPAPVA